MTLWRITVGLWAGSLLATLAAQERPLAPAAANGLSGEPALRQFLKSHFLDCHDQATKTGGLALDEAAAGAVEANTEVWERVVRKLAARQMPPKPAKRPAENEYDAALSWLESSLDALAAARPNPGRSETF